MKRPRVLLADDHRIVSEGLRTLLEPEFDLVASVEDGRALVEETLRLDPDVVVADISMPLLNGIEAIRQLGKQGCRAKFVVLTMHADATYVGRALEAGARGYVLKHSAPSELLTAIRDALEGRVYVTPKLGRQVFGPGGTGGEAPTLTPRQREVLQLIVEGRSARQIAELLKISRRTVEFHKYRMMDELGVRTVPELIRWAVEHDAP